MKKLFIFCLASIILFVLPDLALGHSVRLTSPASGASMTEQYPTFNFDYDTNRSDDWALLEVATSPDVGTDGEFLFGNVKIYSGPLFNPQKSFRDSYTKLSPGTYYWRVIVYSIHGGNFHNAASEIRTLIIQSPPPPPPASTSLTIKAENAFLSDTDVTISGRLTYNANNYDLSLSGKPVAIKRLEDNQVVANLTTSSYGSYSHTFKPTQTASYQTSFAGDSSYLASASSTIIINPRVTQQPAPQKQKVRVASKFHRTKCKKDKKYHAKHCKAVSRNKKQSAKNKKFHSKKCSKTILK